MTSLIGDYTEMRRVKSKFWDKVCKCDHSDLYPDYLELATCFTCEHGTVVHCRKCGVYITSCDCGWLNYMSGWPPSRHPLKGCNK